MQKIIRLIAAIIFFSVGALMGQNHDQDGLRKQAMLLHQQENYAEAVEIFRQLLRLPPSVSGPERRWQDFLQAADCLQKLNQPAAAAELEEQITLSAEHSWQLKWYLAEYILKQDHGGYLLEGKFYRGWPHGRGEWLRVDESDRRRALQLFYQAWLLWQTEESRINPQQQADFYCAFAVAFLGSAGQQLLDNCQPGLAAAAWRLQNLSDLSRVPDWDSPENEEVAIAGAPSESDGQPVYFALPDTFAQATNDGERFRWLLQQAGDCTPRGDCQARFILANYSYSLYGTQTLQGYFYPRQKNDEDGRERSTGLLSLRTLEDDETVARLAGGIRRFRLPRDYDFLALYADLLKRGAAAPEWLNGHQALILQYLAEMQENRHQPARALPWWQRYAQLHPEEGQRQIEKITGSWATFLPTAVQVFGDEIAVELRFRNAQSGKFQLFRLDLPGIIQEAETRILAGREQNLNYHFAHLGSWLMEENNQRFIGARVQEWSESLEPAEGHRDRVRKIRVPLPAPGAYWLVCELPGGNISRIPVLAQEYLLFNKNLQQETLWQLCKAKDGSPAPAAQLQILAWQIRWEQSQRKAVLRHQRYPLTTDENGSAYLSLPQQDNRQSSWHCLVKAELPEEFLCAELTTTVFRGISSHPPSNRKAFLLTDRPLYRPNQIVQYAGWLQEATYTEQANPWVGQAAALWLQAPGEKPQALSDAAEPGKGLPQLRFSAQGGIAGEYHLPPEARLGVYSLLLSTPGKEQQREYWGSLQFRVEEYQKPEYEVLIDAPEGAIKLGETFTVPIRARYYFGAPVTRARARIKVLRYEQSTDFWPVRPWDWLYGPGYWWVGGSQPWLPDREQWSSSAPPGFWLPPRPTPAPEVVAQIEQEFAEDGQIQLTIDTGTAKQLYGNRDHRYEIVAEVRDLSRRTVVGRGQVLVGRKQFRLQAWTNGGHFRSGEMVTALAQASNLSGQPISGLGRLQLLRIRYDAQQQPQESALQHWELPFDEHGRAEQRLQILQPGQYRLSWELQPVEAAEEMAVGSCLLSVYGSNTAEDRDYRYDFLELVPDRAEYAPGETARLRLNTARPNSLVLLFLRPQDGICNRPQILRLNGKSQEIEIPVTPADRPNFFLEALLVSDGVVRSVLRSLAVPPSSRILELEVVPAYPRLLPGSEAVVDLRLTDAFGQPFVGELAISVYDKSLEYLSGGSNIPAIKPHFWKWRRRHYPSHRTMYWSLRNSLREQERHLESIGLFDWELLQEDEWRAEPLALASPLGGGGAATRQMMAVGDGGSTKLALAGALESNQEAYPTAENKANEKPLLRQNFADTAYWIAGRHSDSDGRARLAFPLPDSLTTWKLRVWAMGAQCQVGESECEFITAKNVLVRLQAPRFFVERDEVILSAVVHNYFPEALSLQTSLLLSGDCLELPAGVAARQTVLVPAAGQRQVEWQVRVVRAGEAIIRVQALGEQESDALEQRFPVKVRGQEILLGHSGVIEPDQSSAEAQFILPQEIRHDSARLEIACSPGLAWALLDAIPYLVNCPHACTEQTLNRFLPAVLARNTLQKLGLPLAELARQTSNLNAQELGLPADRYRAEPGQRYPDWKPIFEEEILQKMIQEGLESLRQMQCRDGGWGWFSGWGESSSPYFTALVVHGLLLARQSQLPLPAEILPRGLAWLQRQQQESWRCLQLPREANQHKPQVDHLDALVFQVLALSREEQYYHPAMAELLFRDKKHLNPYGKALFALAEWEYLQLAEANGKDAPQQSERLQALLRNLRQFIQRDDQNQTAWLNLGTGNFWWRWYGDEIETQAAFLKLLCRTGEGRSELSRALVKYLLNNRQQGRYWRSTRSTAAVLEAFAEFLEISGEGRSELEIELRHNGRMVAQERYTPQNLFTARNRFLLTSEDLPTGEQKLEILKKGAAPLYFNAYLQYFSQQDFIPAAGLEVAVQRRTYRLIREDAPSPLATAGGGSQLARREHYRRELLPPQAQVQIGELLEVELILESKNDYEYLLLEDYKAGCSEALENRSGYQGNNLNAYQEFRDDRVSMFIPLLTRGKHTLSYRLRVETKGEFSALPSKLSGVYAPELQANAEEQKISAREE